MWPCAINTDLRVQSDTVQHYSCKNLWCTDFIPLINRPITNRLIGRMPVPCEYCASNVPRTNIEEHKRRCEKRPLRCQAPECSFESRDRETFAMHLANEHREQLIERHERLFTSTRDLKIAEEQVHRILYWKYSLMIWILWTIRPSLTAYKAYYFGLQIFVRGSSDAARLMREILN